ncbi:unnamed protein product [Bursaphelenchus okinawaensis]|uniref:G_PROTEIN_RECEP_F1_2 domain-containing protein n=1 Tax=Bursaphelenchus okinawaensis TaxID=465554 RepID=A0A811L5Q0_9BILA|nr:unnamed protein product [Bursaphelenchus okinawaensis]CAG9118273.1 unnamed protein product [Bursaphelenchus okinawaensis]
MNFDCNYDYGNLPLEYSILLISIVTNVAVLIVFKKILTDDNRYGCVLQLNSGAMIINSVLKAVTRVHFYTEDMKMFARVEGLLIRRLLKHVPILFQYVIIVIDKIGCYFIIFTTVIPFFCRYIIVVKNRIPSCADYYKIVGFGLFMAAFFGGLPAISSYFSMNQVYQSMDIDGELLSQSCPNPALPFMVMLGSHVGEQLKASTLLFVVIGSYGIIYYCTTRVACHIRHGQEVVSQKTRALQEQLLFAMRIQAAVPSFFSLVPFLISDVAFVTQYYPNEALFLLYISLLSLNFINPMLIIFTVKEVRRQLFARFIPGLDVKRDIRVASSVLSFTGSHSGASWRKNSHF